MSAVELRDQLAGKGVKEVLNAYVSLNWYLPSWLRVARRVCQVQSTDSGSCSRSEGALLS